MSKVRRTEKGTFAPGQSGNPNGPRIKRERDPKLPAARRDAIFRVADRKIPVTIDGKTERISIFEACVLQLGRAGATGNRISAKDFINMALATSEADLTRRLTSMAMIERMNAVEEENSELRKKTGQRSGVVHLPSDHWEELQERRLDDGIHEEHDEEEN
jgi:hypothetical protein